MYGVHLVHHFLVGLLKVACGHYMDAHTLSRNLVACEDMFSKMVVTRKTSPLTFQLNLQSMWGERWRPEEVGWEPEPQNFPLLTHALFHTHPSTSTSTTPHPA